MSFTTATGKLKEIIKNENEDLESVCKRLSNVNKLPKRFRNYTDYLIDECSDKYIFVNDKIYEIFDVEEGEFVVLKENDDKTISFSVAFSDTCINLEGLLKEELQID